MKHPFLPVRMAVRKKTKEVLAQMWRGEKPCALLGMDADRASMGNSMEVPPKIEDRITF